MTTQPNESVLALQSLGFSEIEAAIYSFLLEESPVTGYRIAHALDKPVANTYKSIKALEAMGAVIVEESENRLCRAVPPDELFAQMKRKLDRQCEQASEALARLKAQPDDERVYRLVTRDQVMERARQMIRRAEQVVIINAYPQPLSGIRDELEEASNRGIGVLLKVYEPTQVFGTSIVLSNEAGRIAEELPVQELSLVVDAREQLQAFLDPNGRDLIQAIWSGSVFLAFNHFNALYCEWQLTRLISQINENQPREMLMETTTRAYPLMRTPGYFGLLDSLQNPERSQRG
jgi:sugar-specific transcriptional regulator TrmB